MDLKLTEYFENIFKNFEKSKTFEFQERNTMKFYVAYKINFGERIWRGGPFETTEDLLKILRIFLKILKKSYFSKKFSSMLHQNG
jgi:hypothetical protein